MSAVGDHAGGDGPGPAQARRQAPRWTRFILPAYSWLVIAYLVFPIAVMIVYSFNKVTTGLPQVSFAWNGFTPQWYQQWNDVPQLTVGVLAVDPARRSPPPCWPRSLGTLLALALVRYRPPRLPRQVGWSSRSCS